MNTQAKSISNKFNEIINREFTSIQLADVIAKNNTSEYAGCCATHDYCDANMLMDEAFQEIMQREFIFFNDEQLETQQQNQDDTDLLNEAWYISKANNFQLA